MQDFISVLTPTYNRAHFLPFLFMNYARIDWPRDRMEIIIIDDSDEDPHELIQELAKKYGLTKCLRYKHLNKKIPLGRKRNMLNEMAKGQYLACYDDDDISHPERIKTAVKLMKEYRRDLAGSSSVYILDVDDANPYQCYATRFINSSHVLNGTMIYTQKYIKKRRYSNVAELGEEAIFTKNHTQPCVQIPSKHSIICLMHSRNTFEKNVDQHCDRIAEEVNINEFVGKKMRKWLNKLIYAEPEEKQHRFFKDFENNILYERVKNDKGDIEIKKH